MIESAQVYQVSIPMTLTFSHARAARACAENIIVSLSAEGYSGLGEGVPREYVTGESLDSAYLALSKFDLNKLSACIQAPTFHDAVCALEALSLSDQLVQNGKPGLAAACALELAVLDLLGKKFSVSLRVLAGIVGGNGLMNEAARNKIPLCYVLGYDQPLEVVSGYVPAQVRLVKIKVGKDDDEDVARVRKIRSLVGNDFPLYVDANMAWTLERALSMVERLKSYNVLWYEEPLAQGDYEGYRTFRMKSGAKVALDESMCSVQQARTAIDRSACDIFNIRTSKCGGMINSLRIYNLAKAHGVSCMVGGQVGQSGILCAADWCLMTSIADMLSNESLLIPTVLVESPVNEPLPETAPDRWVDIMAQTGIGVTANLNVISKFCQRSSRWDSGSGRWVGAGI